MIDIKLLKKRMDGVGRERVKINPSVDFKIAEIKTRAQVRAAIADGNIIIVQKKGVARKNKVKLVYNNKTIRMSRVRLLRAHLKAQRADLTATRYRRIYKGITQGILLNKKRLNLEIAIK